MNGTKEAFLKFVKDMTSGLMGAQFESGAHADLLQAKRIAEFDPQLAKLVSNAAEARLEVCRHIKSRAEHGTR